MNIDVDYVITPAAYSACFSDQVDRYDSAYMEYSIAGTTGSVNFDTTSSPSTTQESRWSGIACCTYTVPTVTDGSPANDDHSSDGIVAFDAQNGVVGVYTVVVDLSIVGVDLCRWRTASWWTAPVTASPLGLVQVTCWLASTATTSK